MWPGWDWKGWTHSPRLEARHWGPSEGSHPSLLFLSLGERNGHLPLEGDILTVLPEVTVTQMWVGPCLDILVINSYFLRERESRRRGGGG